MGMPERIKRARLEAGLSQRKLAQLVKGTEASIIRYESGQARPRPARLKAVAESTNKPISYFLEDDFDVPTTLERYQVGEEKRYQVEKMEPSYLAESTPSYLARLGGMLSKIEEELQNLSRKINLLIKEEKHPAHRSKK